MFREPFFEILEVIELRGRSMADIAGDIVKSRNVSLREIRGDRRDRFIVSVRHEIINRLMAERSDLSSSRIGAFLHCEPSTVRHHWRAVAQ